MLVPSLQKNDRKARLIIFSFSIFVLLVVVVLSRVQLKTSLPFDVHLFAMANAVINFTVAVLLVAALVAVKKLNFVVHRNIMISALVLSALFLVSYIAHHLLAGDTKFGDTDHNEIVSDAERLAVGKLRYAYYLLLLTHIPLAALILPLILFTAYRGLTGEYTRHKKIARITWPLWFYVAVSGVLVYWLINPYYS